MSICRVIEYSSLAVLCAWVVRRFARPVPRDGQVAHVIARDFGVYLTVIRMTPLIAAWAVLAAWRECITARPFPSVFTSSAVEVTPPAPNHALQQTRPGRLVWIRSVHLGRVAELGSFGVLSASYAHRSRIAHFRRCSWHISAAATIAFRVLSGVLFAMSQSSIYTDGISRPTSNDAATSKTSANAEQDDGRRHPPACCSAGDFSFNAAFFLGMTWGG